MTYKARLEGTASGSDDVYGISFPYIDKTHIKLYLDGVLTGVTLNWLTSSTVKVVPVIGVGKAYSFRRVTPSDTMLVTFQGGTFKPGDSNKANNQLLYIEQEATDNLTEQLNTITASITSITLVGTGTKDSDLIEPTGNDSQDTANLLAAMATGGYFQLRPPKYGPYGLLSQIALSNRSGFYCKQGRATINQKAATTGFTSVTQNSSLFDKVGFYGVGLDQPLLYGLNIVREAASGVRTCSPVGLRNCTNIKVGIEASGFGEMDHGLVMLDACVEGEVEYVYGHDCAPNNTTGSAYDMTVLEIDDNYVTYGVISSKLRIGSVLAKNFALGATPRHLWYQQSNCLRIASKGEGLNRVNLVRAEGAGQAVDLWGDKNVIDCVIANSTTYRIVKFPYGASKNFIGAVIGKDTGLSAIRIEGYNTTADGRTQVSSGNKVIGIDVRNVGSLRTANNAADPATSAYESGICVDGVNTGYAQKAATNNEFQGYLSGNATNDMRAVFGCYSGAGTGNKFVGDGDTFDTSIGFSEIQSTVSGVQIIQRGKKTKVLAYCNTNTATAHQAPIHLDTVIDDNLGEWDTSNYRWTCKKHGRYRIMCQVAISQLPTGNAIGVELWANLNGTNAQRGGGRSFFNTSGANQDGWAMASWEGIFQPGDLATFLWSAKTTGASPANVNSLAPLTGAANTYCTVTELD